jgi:hypothetical protein
MEYVRSRAAAKLHHPPIRSIPPLHACFAPVSTSTHYARITTGHVVSALERTPHGAAETDSDPIRTVEQGSGSEKHEKIGDACRSYGGGEEIGGVKAVNAV